MRTFLPFAAVAKVWVVLAQHKSSWAETGPSLRQQARLDNLKKADFQGDDPVCSICNCREWRQ